MRLKYILIHVIILGACGRTTDHNTPEREDNPNVIIIFTDDQGYQDVACFGSPNIKTPNLDSLAAQGIRFTDFYDAQPVCSASRAALLTGCYPSRVGIMGALMPHARIGLNPNEETLAELCKSRGYATAMFGKWHLGDHPSLLPIRQGFDQYFGLPYSNDMWPKHPNNASIHFPRLPLLRQDSVIGYLDEDQHMLTTWYTEHAVQFIHDNKDRPFFLYVAHNMPHVPLFVSDKFQGRSERGLYGDVIMELDWSVGQIIEALRKNHLDENTLVIFASDNGPWLSYGDHAGSALPLREGKGTVLEGGVRVPCIMRWPGHIPAGAVQRKPAMTIDLLPTIAGLIHARLPQNEIDGKDIWPLIINAPGAENPHEAYFFYYKNNELEGMRSGAWKLYFPHEYRSLEGRSGGTGGMPVEYNNHVKMGLELYDLEHDIRETTNVAEMHPDVVARLQAMAAAFRKRMGDELNGMKGTEVREPARVEWD